MTPTALRQRMLDAFMENFDFTAVDSPRCEDAIDKALGAALEAAGVTDGVLRVVAERNRQRDEEGFSDDSHYLKGELARVGAAYAQEAATGIAYPELIGTTIKGKPVVPYNWPWRKEWWKPTTPLRDLEKAGACIMAQIDVLESASHDTANV